MITNLIKKSPVAIGHKFKLFFVLLIVISGFIGMELFFPSLPGVANALSVNAHLAQYAISIYLLGYGGAQLIYGVLSDRCGRRPLLLAGFLIFIIGSLFGALSQSIVGLLIARVVQGIGMSACATLSRTILRDLYSGAKMAKAGSIITAGITITSLIAPIIGGVIQHHIGYRGNLWFMFFYAIIVMLLLFLFFPETGVPSSTKQSMLKITRQILKNSAFIQAVICAGLTLAVFIFIGQFNPFIIQINFHYSSAAYGFIAAIIALGELVGTLLNSKLVERIGIDKMNTAGFLIILFSGICLILLHFMLSLSIFPVVLFSFLCLGGVGIVLPNVSAKAFSQFDSNIGLVGAIYGTFQVLITVAATVSISLVKHPSEFSLGIGLIVLALFCLLITKANSVVTSH